MPNSEEMKGIFENKTAGYYTVKTTTYKIRNWFSSNNKKSLRGRTTKCVSVYHLKGYGIAKIWQKITLN